MRGFIALLVLLLTLPASVPAGARDVIAGPVSGKVLSVVDGDTIAVRRS